MNPKQARLAWALILIFLFGIVVATFCYFLGTTDTLGEAFQAYWRFGAGLIPLFLIVALLAAVSLRRLDKKERNDDPAS